MKDKFLSADIFRVNSSASSPWGPRRSARIRAESAGRSAESAGRSAESAGKLFWRKFAGTGRNRAESARIRAEPRRKVNSGGGGVQQQKRSCRREKPKMSFVFFVLFCSFSKHVQNRRFCVEFGQKCVLKKEQKRS